MLRGAVPLFALALALNGFPAAAQKTENVTYKSGDDTVTGYLVFPTASGNMPPSSSFTNGGASMIG